MLSSLRSVHVLALLVLLSACASRTQVAAPGLAGCDLPIPSEVIAVPDPKPTELQERFDLPDAPALWAPAPPDAQIERYRQAVIRKLGGPPDPRALLTRQHAVYLKSPRGPADAANSQHVLEGLGTLGPASCLETALWKAQDQRFPQLTHPTEFGAFILRRPGQVRVYFSSLDRLGQKIRAEVTQRVEADVREGWTLTAHLHVHPFLFDRVPGDRMWTEPYNQADVGGAVAPSATDVQFYRSLRTEVALRAAWVTNGLDTGRYPARTFATFASAPTPAPTPAAPRKDSD